MVLVVRVVPVPIVIHSAVGVIDNTMDQGDGFKAHVMRHSGRKTMIRRRKTHHLVCRYGYRMIWKFGRNEIRRFVSHKSLHCIQNSLQFQRKVNYISGDGPNPNHTRIMKIRAFSIRKRNRWIWSMRKCARYQPHPFDVQLQRRAIALPRGWMNCLATVVISWSM